MPVPAYLVLSYATGCVGRSNLELQLLPPFCSARGRKGVLALSELEEDWCTDQIGRLETAADI